jgi:hypothetical protein
MIDAPVWTAEELQQERRRSIEIFRQQRIEEPLEQYLEAFDRTRGCIETLLEASADLRDTARLTQALRHPDLLYASRYLMGPPISADDLQTLAEAGLSARNLANPEIALSIVQIILRGLDRRRFPWIAAGREPTDSERSGAVLASAALMAMRKLETARRNDGKEEQERAVQAAFEASGLRLVPPRTIDVLAQAPRPGEFCRESLLGGRKADLIVGLWDQRVMAIECKVSNSGTNSIKRLNNDAAVKAEAWRDAFGTRQIVPTAVLSGVFQLLNLESAQTRGLKLFWAHDLGRLVEWIEKARL